MTGVLRADLRFAAFTLLGLIVFPFFFHAINGYAGLATQILIVSIASIGFNLLLGYTGLLSYGHAMFYGSGGYIAAILLIRAMPTHPNLWLAVIGATLVTTVLALLIGALAVRLYGIYFALLTLAFAQMVFFVVEQAKDWTSGDDGLQSFPNGVAADRARGTSISARRFRHCRWVRSASLERYQAVVHLRRYSAAFSSCSCSCARSIRSQFGEVLTAIRENEERSSLVGFNPAAYRLAAFAISGALTGLLRRAARALRRHRLGRIARDRSQRLVRDLHDRRRRADAPRSRRSAPAMIMYLESVLSAHISYWRLVEGIIFVAVIVFLPTGIVGLIRTKVMERAQKNRALLAGTLRARPGGPTQSVGGAQAGPEHPSK